MLPKKIWLIVKLAGLICLLQFIQLAFTSFKAYMHIVNEYRKIKEAPIANLYRTDLPPIKTQQCHDHVTVYNHVMVTFRNMTLNPHRAQAEAQAGAALEQVREQKEDSEIYKVSPGFLALPCVDKSLQLSNSILHDLNAHVRKWRDSIIQVKNESHVAKLNQSVERLYGLSIMIERNEYANVYWTLMDLYDVFIAMRYLNYTSHDTSIILLDARPRGHLDDLWRSFHSVRRLQDIHVLLQIDHLSWRFDRINSPFLNKKLKFLPLMNDFREFVLISQNIPVSIPVQVEHTPDCAALRILIVFRHDYVAHPRNPKGTVSRKITNEEEILNATSSVFHMHSVQGVQLDRHGVREQLRLLAGCDVMLGMHGAALAFSVFMPPASALIELFPAYYGRPNWHMEQLARWSGHAYYKARLEKKLDDANKLTTRVPAPTVVSLVRKAVKHVCQARSVL